MKAIVVDINGKHAAVINENGEVVKIYNSNYELGQCVEYKEIKKRKINKSFSNVIKKAGSAAAAVMLLLTAGTATAYALPYGTVSIDAEPVIEYTINCFDYVIDVRVADSEIESILDDMDLSKLRNHKIDDAVQTTVEHMDTGGYSTFEINAETKNDEHTERLRSMIEEAFKDEPQAPEDIRTVTEPGCYNDITAGEYPDNINNDLGVPFQWNEDKPTAPEGDRPESVQDRTAGPEGNDSPLQDEPKEQEGGGVPFLIHE